MNEEVPEGRVIDLTVEIDASLEAVWRALTEADELVRWFPVYAKVEPGVGGRISFSWTEGPLWGSPIEIWEPGRHLRLGDDSSNEGAGSRIAVEYFLSPGEGGGTVLRLVHSGFEATAEWAEYLDSLESGWRYFLANLKHYLERHPGVPRDLVSQRRPAGVPRAEFWNRLLGPGGLALQPSPNQLTEGQSFTFRLGDTDVRARVLMLRAPVHFAAILESLNDGLLFVELEQGTGNWHAGIWLSTYGMNTESVTGLRAGLEAVADRVFSSPSAAGAQAEEPGNG